MCPVLQQILDCFKCNFSSSSKYSTSSDYVFCCKFLSAIHFGREGCLFASHFSPNFLRFVWVNCYFPIVPQILNWIEIRVSLALTIGHSTTPLHPCTLSLQGSVMASAGLSLWDAALAWVELGRTRLVHAAVYTTSCVLYML